MPETGPLNLAPDEDWFREIWNDCWKDHGGDGNMPGGHTAFRVEGLRDPGFHSSDLNFANIDLNQIVSGVTGVSLAGLYALQSFGGPSFSTEAAN